MQSTMSRRPILAAGTMVGIGMGGFVDGILFHQILQVHNMLSNRIPKDTVAHVEINMFWDGLFHAFCWVLVAAGLGLTWRAATQSGAERSGRAYFGALLLGWGVFNGVEGLIDHEILQIHHVYQIGNHLLWDLIFLGSGAVLIALGLACIRTGGRSSRPT